MDISKINDEDIQVLVRRRLLGQNLKTEPPKPQNSWSKQKVIKVQDTCNYLDSGWEYVARLTEDSVIIKNNFTEE